MSVYLDDGDLRLYHGDALETLASLPDGSVDCCITSPPYYGLRDYGVDGQIGLEDTPEAFLTRLVGVFREVRRVLADHGTCWLNLGDSYASGGGFSPGAQSNVAGSKSGRYGSALVSGGIIPAAAGAKPKDLLLMPARLALALQADGWYLRSDIIWHKPNPMPESVTDRPTGAHEHVFLLTKAPRYWYDAEALKEPSVIGAGAFRKFGPTDKGAVSPRNDGNRDGAVNDGTRNIRNVWTIPTQRMHEAHFATFPEELVRRCLLAGCPEQVCRECGEPRRRIVEVSYENPGNRNTNGPRSAARRHETPGFERRLEKRVTTTGWSDCGHDGYRPGVVLDPFMGSGTVAKVARHHGRHAIGIDLNADYLAIAARRTSQLGLLAGGHVDLGGAA